MDKLKRFKYEWSSVIVDIVIKKDLDGHEFADCWEEDYDWTELDKYVIENFESDVLGFMRVELQRIGEAVPSNKVLFNDLKKYYSNLFVKRKELK